MEHQDRKFRDALKLYSKGSELYMEALKDAEEDAKPRVRAKFAAALGAAEQLQKALGLTRSLPPQAGGGAGAGGGGAADTGRNSPRSVNELQTAHAVYYLECARADAGGVPRHCKNDEGHPATVLSWQRLLCV